MPLRLPILLLFLLIGLAGFSQFEKLHFEKYTTTNGLSGNNTTAIMQDSRGFLWVGTNKGLNRFDGKKVKRYNVFGKKGLTDLYVTCLVEDEDGNILAGTSNGLNKINPFTDSITHYYEGTGPGTIPFKWCNNLYIDKSRKIWLSTEKGVALYDAAKNSFTNFPVAVYGKDPKINKFIYRMLEDSKGRFWLATSFGVKLFDRKTTNYQSFHFPETGIDPQKENAIITIFEDHRGIIWAGTWGGGILRYNEGGNQFEKIQLVNSTNNYQVVTAITSISDKQTERTVFAINGQLYTLQETGGQFISEHVELVSYNKGDHFPYGISLETMIHDNQEHIWASSSEGLYKISQPDPAFRNISVTPKSDHSLIYHIIPDINEPENIFYLSTLGGWWKYEATTGKSTPFQLPAASSNLLKFINSWKADGNGYWFSSVYGFGYYDLYKNTITDLSHLIQQNSGQLNSGFIVQDEKGKVWVTMRRSGMIVYDPATKKTEVLFADSLNKDNMLGKSITNIKYTKDGALYVCVAGKLYKINTQDYSYKIIPTPAYEEPIDVLKIAPEKVEITSDNHILVSSRLLIYELKNDSLHVIYPAAGLSPVEIENMDAGPDGLMWVTSPDGVYKTDASFKKWQNVTSGTGWDNTGFTNINTNHPGELIMNGDAQITTLNYGLIKKDATPPGVVITSVRYGDKEDYLVSLKPAHIRTAFNEALEIELSAIDFSGGKENRIVYMLEGRDKNWKELTEATLVRYDQLPPGDYTFKAKTINAAGAESMETIMPFTVIPPFYKQVWFLVVMVLVVSGFLYGMYRYRLRKAVEMERLRTRIATDLHDDIGTTLSSISFYSEAARQKAGDHNPEVNKILLKMGESSRKMVGSMSDIVWAINPKNDDLGKIITRMQSYAAELCALKNINLDFQVDEHIPESKIRLDLRRNIYMIFKEALNNTLKYSDCKNITIKVAIRHQQFNMEVADDGKGFNTETESAGNGLHNMRKRASEINSELHIESAPGWGTRVSLFVKIT